MQNWTQGLQVLIDLTHLSQRTGGIRTVSIFITFGSSQVDFQDIWMVKDQTIREEQHSHPVNNFLIIWVFIFQGVLWYFNSYSCTKSTRYLHGKVNYKFNSRVTLCTNTLPVST